MEKTKYVEMTINGKTYNLPEEEVKTENLIRDALKIKEKMDPFNERLDDIKEQLIEMADEAKGEKGTVRMKSVSGTAVISYGVSYSYDEEIMDKVEKVMHKPFFRRIFKKNTVYKPAKQLKIFLESKQEKELERLKVEILKAQDIKIKKPSIKILKNEEE